MTDLGLLGGKLSEEIASNTGKTCEHFCTTFLRRHFDYQVVNGLFFDSKNNRSEEIDAIMLAPGTPRFPVDSSNTFYRVPIECAIAAIEVKQQATQSYLRDAFTKFVRVKKLHLIPDRGLGTREPGLDNKYPLLAVIMVEKSSVFGPQQVREWLEKHNTNGMYSNKWSKHRGTQTYQLKAVIDFVGIVGQGSVVSSKFPDADGKYTYLNPLILDPNKPYNVRESYTAGTCFRDLATLITGCWQQRINAFPLEYSYGTISSSYEKDSEWIAAKALLQLGSQYDAIVIKLLTNVQSKFNNKKVAQLLSRIQKRNGTYLI